MHELSLCRAIASVVERARADRPVTTVHLQVGQLRQVVPETLCYCWTLVTDAGPLAGSVLEIDQVRVVLRCRACLERTAVGHALVLVCGSCGSGDVAVVCGEELLVTSIDLGPRIDLPEPHP